jgi:hypothetical protein
MNLKDFISSQLLADTSCISEAISSGRSGRTSKLYIPETNELQDIVTWLDEWNAIGRENYIGAVPDKSPVRGKIVYIVYTQSSKPKWIVVFNQFGQEVTISLNGNDWCDIQYAKSKTSITANFKVGIRCIARMLENPDKRLRESDIRDIEDEVSGVKLTIEAISSGKHGKYEYPGNFNDMVDWIESLGCQYTDHFDEKPKKPQYYTTWYEDMIIIRAYLNNLIYQIRMEFAAVDKKLFWVIISERKNITSSGKDIYDSQQEKDIETALSYTEEILTGKFNG